MPSTRSTPDNPATLSMPPITWRNRKTQPAGQHGQHKPSQPAGWAFAALPAATAGLPCRPPSAPAKTASQPARINFGHQPAPQAIQRRQQQNGQQPPIQRIHYCGTMMRTPAAFSFVHHRLEVILPAEAIHSTRIAGISLLVSRLTEAETPAVRACGLSIGFRRLDSAA